MKETRDHRLPSLAVNVSTAGLIVMSWMLGAAPAAEQHADLVLRGGKVVTMDDSQPTAEAVAVRGDRIVAVGDAGKISKLIGQKTRVIEIEGGLVAPGFIDGHGHFVGLGRSKMILDLMDAKSWEEIVAMVEQAARTTPPGRWIVGRGWHQGKWVRPPTPNVDGYPTHALLSAATPRHPVMLTHGTGHMCMANAAAMERAGVDEQTQSGEGGEILRDASGAPIGAFRENAAALISRAYARSQAKLSKEQKRKDLLTAIQLAGEECLKYGVTSFHDAGASFATIDVFKQLALGGRLPVRLWVMVSEGNESLARRMASYRMIGVGDNHLTVRSVKRLLDGALGVHGAWLLAPYNDLPESKGLNTLSIESLSRAAELALEHDFQMCVHAIGDRANRETFDVFEKAFRKRPGKSDLRWRIEHAQHVDPADMPRFRQLGVIASMQGVHCTSDAPFVVKRLGRVRAEQSAYAWRSLFDAGAVVINGTDTPVERIDPIACFYSSVTRRRSDGEAFFPDQRMTREEALRSYTRDAAYAAFEEDLKGTLSPGKLADIVVLSEDIVGCAEEQIRRAEVLYTIVGGRVLYAK